MTPKKLKIVLPFVLLAVAIATTIALVQARPVAQREERVVEAPLVRVLRVAPSDVPLRIASQGTVVPHAQTNVAAQVAGRIEWVSPKFAAGGTFARGEVMARLDARDHEVAAAQARAAIAQATLRMSREQAEADVAAEEWKKLGKGEASPLVLREPQIAEARAAVAAAEAALMQAQLNIERSTVRAPFDGVLLQKMVDHGSFVAPGTPMALLAASDYAEIELPVSGDDLAHVDLTRPVPVTLRASFGGTVHEWPARVVRTGPQIDSRTRMLPLIARVDRPFARTANRPPLHIGQFVHATIAGSTAANVIEIPRGAMRQGQVMIVDGEERLRFRDVEVLRVTNESAYLRAGLAGGEAVVLSTIDAPVEGMKVRIAATTEEPR